MTACSGPAGTIDDATDCDDTDPEINPRGWDICADGIDQDCTGSDKSCPYAGTVCVSDIEHAHITPNDGDWSIPECMMGVGDIDGDGVGDLTFSDWDNQAREMAYLFYGPIAAAYTIAKPTPWLS